mgnify:CR=1 FL=1
MLTASPADACFVLASVDQARLLRCTRTPNGRCNISDIDALQSPFPEPERGRPNALKGMTGHSYAAPHHTVEEDHRRFDKLLAQWINEQIDRRDIKRLTVFTAARSIKEISEHLGCAHREQVELVAKNLAGLTNEALQEHEAVLALLARRPEPKTTRAFSGTRKPRTDQTE